MLTLHTQPVGLPQLGPAPAGCPVEASPRGGSAWCPPRLEAVSRAAAPPVAGLAARGKRPELGPAPAEAHGAHEAAPGASTAEAADRATRIVGTSSSGGSWPGGGKSGVTTGG